MTVAALDHIGRSLTEVLELLGWLRDNQVEVISLWESIDQDSAMGLVMLHLAIVFAEMERDLAREITLAGLGRVKGTVKYLGRRKGAARKQTEEIQNMPQRDGLSWGRIATIIGLPSSSIQRRSLAAAGVGFRGRRMTYLPDANCGRTLVNSTQKAPGQQVGPVPSSGGMWTNSRQRPRRRQPDPRAGSGHRRGAD